MKNFGVIWQIMVIFESLIIFFNYINMFGNQHDPIGTTSDEAQHSEWAGLKDFSPQQPLPPKFLSQFK